VPPAPAPQLAADVMRERGDRHPTLRLRNRLLISSQNMMWRALREGFGRYGRELEAALDEAATQGPGTLEVDPAFAFPDYQQAEFHRQPGGYAGDSLAGIVYHYGTKVFFTGANDQDELHEAMARSAPAPRDGRVRRVLDIACSIGQGTTALKSRFAEAEVFGIDVSAPLLRYAHKRAIDLGAEVHFAQRLAEATRFPDAHFDFVLSTILFHEVPFKVTQQVCAEMFRVLRPGGVFNVFDFPSGEPLPPALQYFLDIDSRFNGEPWSLEFVYGDLTAALEAAGFRVTRGPVLAGALRTWFCEKP